LRRCGAACVVHAVVSLAEPLADFDVAGVLVGALVGERG